MTNAISTQQRERAIVIGALVTISLLAWAYVIRLSSGMRSTDVSGHTMDMMMPQVQSWQPTDVAFMFLMWTVMMLAMMTPSAAPMILSYTGLVQRAHETRAAARATAAFLLGYIIVWLAFSVGATLLQWALHAAGMLSPDLMRAAPVAGGLLLVIAGAYQFTPLKHVCLAKCRSPSGFLMTEWREGTRGALVMGLRHGLFCVGCCWSLMLVLFAVGVMNLLWVALIALYVLAEKVAPGARRFSRAMGIVTIAGGTWLVMRGLTL